MRTLLPLFLLLTACEVTAPATDSCIEFDRNTLHNGRPVTCRMVWCDERQAGNGSACDIATLWCDERTP